MRIITFGTFDLFHIGHLNIFKNCKNFLNQDNYVIVGISSDELNFKKKSKTPIININDRVEIIKSIKYVDEVFIEESLEKKLEYCLKYNIDILIMGSDHIGSFNYLQNNNIKVIYLDRTNNISTTLIENIIKNK
tara:strand:- start:2324 stop:2725 length:402 start_codon:yes stop_codon:yes gene_type:complete